MSVDAANGALDYNWSEEGTESSVGYYMLPSGKEYLTCVFSATTKTGKKITQTDKIESAKASTLYTLNYELSSEEPEHPTDEGGAFFSLKGRDWHLPSSGNSRNVGRRGNQYRFSLVS